MAPTSLLRKVQTPEHLSCETPEAWPLLWACSPVSHFLALCVIWISVQIDFWQFPLSMTFLTLFFPRIMEWLQLRMHFFATLETCLFSHKRLFQKLCFSVNFFFFKHVSPRVPSLHEWFSPERYHLIVVMVVIPNTAPPRLDCKLSEDRVEFLIRASD